MRNPIADLLGKASPPGEDDGEPAERTPESLLSDVEQARQQWLDAKAYFNHVTDPDLIDMAIYSIEAAEKRYMYLLKVARTQGVRLEG